MDMSDGEGKITGAHIAQILSDHKGSPKYSHGPASMTTFAPTPPPPAPPRSDIDQLELDSVGSSK